MNLSEFFLFHFCCLRMAEQNDGIQQIHHQSCVKQKAEKCAAHYGVESSQLFR